MNRVKDIKSNGKVYAQIYDLNSDEGVLFPTDDSAEMQCGFGTIKDTTKKPPHIHKVLKRETVNTSEFFFIYKGSVAVSFFDENENLIGSQEVKAGMGFIQFIGGHGFVFEPNTKYIEVKQGPYLGNLNDKYFINNDS